MKKANSSNSQIQPLSSNGSGLHAQLLQRTGLIPTLGFGPQQYGNINNERKIDQLKNNNQMATQQINNDKATIDFMTQEKARLDAEVEDLKKPKKEAKQKLEKTTNEREMMQDDVAEAERIDMKTKREEDRKNNLQTRKLE